MTENSACTPEKLLEGFFKMSPADQEKIREKLSIETRAAKDGMCCDPVAMMEKMKERGFDPKALCKEMMGKSPSEGDCSPKGPKKNKNC